MTLELPYPPTTNHAYMIRGGRKIKSPRVRAYADEVYIIVAHRPYGQPCRLTPKHRLRVTIEVHPPDRRRRDLANTEKVAVDAVMKALDLDDSQIDRLTLERHPPDRPHGKLVMTIEAIA